MPDGLTFFRSYPRCQIAWILSYHYDSSARTRGLWTPDVVACRKIGQQPIFATNPADAVWSAVARGGTLVLACRQGGRRPYRYRNLWQQDRVS